MKTDLNPRDGFVMSIVKHKGMMRRETLREVKALPRLLCNRSNQHLCLRGAQKCARLINDASREFTIMPDAFVKPGIVAIAAYFGVRSAGPRRC